LPRTRAFLLVVALAFALPPLLHAQANLDVRIETIEGALVNGGAAPAFFEIRTATIDPAVAVCEVNPQGFFICGQMTLPAGDSALVQVTGAGLMLTAAAQKTAGVLFSTTTGGPNAGSDSDLTDMEIVEAPPSFLVTHPHSATVAANSTQIFSASSCPPDANGNPDVGSDGAPGTATATNPDGATSELSPCDASLPTGIEHEQVAADELPEAFRLHPNYPNPFNPETVIRFDLPEAARVRLEVYDVLGRCVLTLPLRRFETGTD
jgi:hypothetical protein